MKNSRVLSKSLMYLLIQGILASYKPRTIKENRHKCDINCFINISMIDFILRKVNNYINHYSCRSKQVDLL